MKMNPALIQISTHDTFTIAVYISFYVGFDNVHNQTNKLQIVLFKQTPTFGSGKQEA